MTLGTRLSIPARVFLGFALVLVSFASLTTVSVVQHDRNARSLRLLHEGYLPLAITVGEARSTQALFAALLDRVLQDEQSATARGWLQVAWRSRPTTLRRALHGVSSVERSAEQAGVMAQIESVRAELEASDVVMRDARVIYGQLASALENEDRDEARRLVAVLHGHEREIRAHFRSAWQDLQAAIAEISEAAAVQERETAIGLGVMTMLALFIGILILVWAQRILRPLPHLHARVAAVTRGDKGSAPLVPRRDDELGRLTRDIEAMIQALATRGERLDEATEARGRLQRLQEQVVAGLRGAILVVDERGRLGTANPAALHLVDVSASSVGMEFADLACVEEIPQLLELVQRVRAGGQAERIAEVRYPREAGRILSIRVQPVDPEEGTKNRATMVVFEDITSEIESQTRQIKTERLAAIGRMAAHVTHEVRNPLSSIGLNIELLEEGLPADEETRALLFAIQNELDRLKGLTDEYLRLARLPSPMLEPDSLGDLMRSLISFLGREMDAAKVVLEASIAEELPPVALDEGQIRQALLNLLRNAREAMPEGGTVHISATANKGGVSVLVQDEGSGVPQAERERIFDLFHTTKESGTGLGLALTREVVVAHGGTIECIDREGQGASFALWFPAAAK